MSKELGKLGEEMAAQYLKEKCHFKILARNFSNRIGELDIVAADKNTIIFVEVKTRRDRCYGRPAEAVEKRKQFKLGKVASTFLSRYSLWNRPCRFDVVEVYIEDDTHTHINHSAGAFIL